MKNLSFEFAFPNIFVLINDETVLVPSMLISTLVACVAINFVPQLMPLWMSWSTRSTV